MKKIKNFLSVVMDILIVLVPLALLAGGFILSTGALWDVLMFAGVVSLPVYDFNMYLAMRRKNQSSELARYMVATVGSLAAFFALVAQAIFSHLHGAEQLLVEASMVWLFILLIIGIISTLIKDQPNSRVLTWAIIMATCWISICVLGGVFDFYEYFSGQEIPQRLGNFFGMLATITGISSFVLMVVGIIQENFRR